MDRVERARSIRSDLRVIECNPIRAITCSCNLRRLPTKFFPKTIYQLYGTVNSILHSTPRSCNTLANTCLRAWSIDYRGTQNHDNSSSWRLLLGRGQD